MEAVCVQRRPAFYSRAMTSRSAAEGPARSPNGAPSPTRLNDLFRQELVEFGPAMMMCDTKGQVTWANAACEG